MHSAAHPPACQGREGERQRGGRGASPGGPGGRSRLAAGEASPGSLERAASGGGARGGSSAPSRGPVPLGSRRRRRAAAMPRAGEAPADRGTAVLALALALALAGSPGGGQHYDYYGWQPEGLSHGRFYGREPQCLDIPPDMQLCRDVGYKRMRLPNLLEHETMAEAKQQASSWVPLLAKQCHTDTQLFLCSLFAPVCLDRPVYPCRSLCEVVRDSCAPVMESYGFPWPEMLHCGKFPSDHELCIAVQFGNSKATPPPGKQEGHCNGMGTHARHLPAVCPHASGDLHAGPPAEPLHPHLFTPQSRAWGSGQRPSVCRAQVDAVSAASAALAGQPSLSWDAGTLAPGQPDTPLPAQSCPRAVESRATLGAALGVNVG